MLRAGVDRPDRGAGAPRRAPGRGRPVLFPILSTPQLTLIVSHMCLIHLLPASENVALGGTMMVNRQVTRMGNSTQTCVSVPLGDACPLVHMRTCVL